MARGSINKVILIGTLGRDPEMRFMPNGNAVCNLNIATNEGYKDKNTGQQVEKTEWHRISAFGRLAEVMGEYLKKGSKCYIEGKLETRDYEKDGIKRYSTSIIANEMTMLDNRQQDNSGGAGGYAAPQPAPAQQQQAAPSAPYGQPQQAAPQAQPSNSFDDFDDDIPF
jgi:single-strand DNA-binding protein